MQSLSQRASLPLTCSDNHYSDDYHSSLALTIVNNIASSSDDYHRWVSIHIITNYQDQLSTQTYILDQLS